MNKIFHALSTAGYLAAGPVVRSLPLAWVFLLGRAAGLAAFRIAGDRRWIAEENIGRALGAAPREARRIAKSSFANLFANLAAMLKTQSMRPEKLLERLTFAIPVGSFGGGGCVIAACHSGNWELLGQLARFFPDVKFGAIYQRLANPEIDQRVRAARERWGLRLFDRAGDIWEAVAFLEAGGALGVLCDQHAGTGGTELPFFGRQVSTTTLPGLLAGRARVPVLPVSVSTTGIARWHIRAGTAIKAGTPAEAALATNRALEESIRANPADWLWAHDRWKGAGA